MWGRQWGQVVKTLGCPWIFWGTLGLSGLGEGGEVVPSKKEGSHHQGPESRQVGLAQVAQGAEETPWKTEREGALASSSHPRLSDTGTLYRLSCRACQGPGGPAA